MTTVVKRGGRRQSFMPSKVTKSIAGALRNAKVAKAKRDKLTKEISKSVVDAMKKKRVVKAVDIRRSVIGRLSRVSKAAVIAWKRSEKKRMNMKKKAVKKRPMKKRGTTKRKTTKKKTARRKTSKKKRTSHKKPRKRRR